MPQNATVGLAGGLRDNGAIGIQGEPAVFRCNTRALSVLRDLGWVDMCPGRCLVDDGAKFVQVVPMAQRAWVASIWFHVNTPLSKSELLYAIETTFALNGFAIIPADDHSIRLGRPAQALRNNGERLERVPPKQ